MVVTGASSGIGEAIARRLSADGARVVAMARRADRLQALADQTGAYPVPADLSDADAVAEACQGVISRFGVPDVIINNAGSGRFLSIEETDPAEAAAQVTLPYLAAFAVTRAFIEPMLARGSGTILQINSPVAVVPWPGAVGYAAGRWALRGFTEALRQDLAGTGIHVGSVTPTRVHSAYFDGDEDSRRRVPRVEALVGTMQPAQVADAVARALVRRPGRDTHVPWRWGLVAPLARALPGPFALLFRVTGHRRRGRGRGIGGRRGASVGRTGAGR